VSNPLMNLYMQFTKQTEQPAQFRRWAILSAVSAALGRRNYFKQGRLTVYPHQYILLSGLPATRKSSAILEAAKLLKQAGYRSFAPKTSTREKFIEDLQIGFAQTNRSDDDTLEDLFTKVSFEESPCYIAAGEFLTFIQQGNVLFINMLSDLWDITDEPYQERFKKTQSVVVHNPIINFIGGVTHETLKMAMPEKILGHGFLSRTIMVHSDPVVDKITFPEDADSALRDAIVVHLERILKMRGVFTATPEALTLIDRIYTRSRPLADARLQAYHGRRLDHMLKLAQACAACRSTHVIDADCVEEANTILSYTEESMGQALGELGDSRNARASQNIMNVLSNANGPVHIDELYKGVMQDVTRHQEFLEMLQNLEKAKKVIHEMSEGAMYYLLARTVDTADTVGVNKSKWLEEFAE